MLFCISAVTLTLSGQQLLSENVGGGGGRRPGGAAQVKSPAESGIGLDLILLSL